MLPIALVAAAVLALAAITWRPLARHAGTHPLVAIGLVLSVAAIAIVTLTPAPAGFANYWQGWGCVQAGWRPDWLPWPFEGRINGRSLNVWMFVPLGAFVALTGTRKPATLWTPFTLSAFALLLPLAVESAQRVLPLDRFCDTRDVADNTYGLVLGIALGLALRPARHRLRRLLPL
ncbi:VanZ family protein [Cryptosporangium aurantiacum]|uniref:VanZ like family protein n=1 Tax=Cryptosporangium aurantiacum TaxID=134849 RepID=A0A1M7N4S5_9ACTN|nr:VanZ family protein [Cryptosporangium aurantiacum]SHM98491.1 VanZ like family protein [Cryptosporangium aurantiacum]